MEMINKGTYQDLQAAGMDDAQAQVVASHIPDWSQFVTKQDVCRLEKRTYQPGDRVIRWMVGCAVGSLVLLAGFVAVSLNLTNIVRALQYYYYSVVGAAGGI